MCQRRTRHRSIVYGHISTCLQRFRAWNLISLNASSNRTSFGCRVRNFMQHMSRLVLARSGRDFCYGFVSHGLDLWWTIAIVVAAAFYIVKLYIFSGILCSGSQYLIHRRDCAHELGQSEHKIKHNRSLLCSVKLADLIIRVCHCKWRILERY